jgi:transcriptional repressor NrdR
MKCPFCNSLESDVKDSRYNDERTSIRRRRVCLKCDARFTTQERVILKQIYVVKKSGMRKPFNIEKMKQSIITATRKSSVKENVINAMIDKIYSNIENSAKNEIHSRKIGEMILQELKKVDEVSYIRFASVYKDFRTAQDFVSLITKIKESTNE